ncbi:GH24083 [Drosophila grimshawi]|uniref:GH24083 n=1 Tax=Drosophila grimshawi TaxID=7222 RepID=B4JNT8_DROGR|nr:GH24083 [Drosophila grimshawi]
MAFSIDEKIGLWCLDGACPAHMSSIKSLLHLANNKTTRIIGNVEIAVKKQQQRADLTLTDVFYVSDLCQSLMSTNERPQAESVTRSREQASLVGHGKYINHNQTQVDSSDEQSSSSGTFEECEMAFMAVTDEEESISWTGAIEAEFLALDRRQGSYNDNHNNNSNSSNSRSRVQSQCCKLSEKLTCAECPHCSEGKNGNGSRRSCYVPRRIDCGKLAAGSLDHWALDRVLGTGDCRLPTDDWRLATGVLGSHSICSRPHCYVSSTRSDYGRLRFEFVLELRLRLRLRWPPRIEE